ncbi:MAG: hypothetical protein ACTJH9_07890 [Pseudoalteromonas sp.]
MFLRKYGKSTNQADIISVNGFSLGNINELKNVPFVMKTGQVYKR